MRKLILILICAAGNLICFCQQVPHALNYQAVARTSSGLIIPSQQISVRFSILDGSINGTVVYQETQFAITNNFGLFTLAIGKGTVTNGTFNGINWGSGDKFLRVELGPGNTGTYDLQGTTQLLSVPYALFAEKSNVIAGNNTISVTNGNIVTGNYQAGNAINITGNTINSNYIGGTGINITGNTISQSNPNLWTPDANGIHYIDNSGSGNVGIGVNSASGTSLSLLEKNLNGVGSAALDINSNDTWQTVVRFRNNTINQEYQINLGGIGNTALAPKSLGIFNNQQINWVWNTDASTSNLAIGSYDGHALVPKSRLHVFNGDININDIGSGIIMKSPNGQCWRVTVSDTGALVTTAIPCL